MAGVLAIALVLAIEHAQQMRLVLGGAVATPTDGSEVDLVSGRSRPGPGQRGRQGGGPRSRARLDRAVQAPPPIPPAATGGWPELHGSTGGRPTTATCPRDLRPVPRPPGVPQNIGAAGSRSIVYTASGAASPSRRRAEDLFTGLPDSTPDGTSRRRFGRPDGRARRRPRLAMGIAIVLVIGGSRAA